MSTIHLENPTLKQLLANLTLTQAAAVDACLSARSEHGLLTFENTVVHIRYSLGEGYQVTIVKHWNRDQ